MTGGSRSQLWVAAGVVGFAVAMACLLLGFKHRAALEGLQRARLALVADEMRDVVERNLGFGMAFGEIATLPDVLVSTRNTEELITGIDVVDPSGKAIYSTDAARRGLLPEHPDGEALSEAVVRNPFGVELGRVSVRYRLDRLQASSAAFAGFIAVRGLAVAILGTLALFLALRAIHARFARHSPASVTQALGRRYRVAALAAVVLAVTASILACAAIAYSSFRDELGPEALRKAETVGRAVDALAQKAMRWQLPLEKLPGMEDLFDSLERQNPEITWIALRADDRVLVGRGNPAHGTLAGNHVELPIITMADPAVLEIAVDPAWVARLFREMALDLAVILLVSLVISFELAVYLTGAGAFRAAAPDPAVSALGAMRAPFFLFLFSEDLSRSFLPLFAGALPVGPFAIPPNLVVSLPIALFMLIVALSQPGLGAWSERIGRRRAFLAGGIIGAAAHLGSAFAGSLAQLLAIRSFAGFAWAVAFVAAQGLVIDNTDRGTRTRGLAVFVGIIMAASMCGPPIGGLLADGLGARWTFAVAAALAAGATLLAWRDLPRLAGPARAPVRTGMSDYAAALANPRFAALLALAAIPAKVIVIAFCFYLVPLYVAQSGHNAAMAGRLIMLYSVMMVLLVPVATEAVERLQRRHASRPHAAFVAAGLALSGLAGLLMLLPLGLAGAAALVLLLGVAQALSIAPQAALVAEVNAGRAAGLGESAVYGVYRLVERLGNAMGPVIAAFLLQLAGFPFAFAAIGGAVLACAIAFYALFREPAAVPVGVAP
ncbi:MAG TPA: MFS transporter [Usitatibacter sp.]|nr:MFS transporter [Usitatibacter sp.]